MRSVVVVLPASMCAMMPMLRIERSRARVGSSEAMGAVRGSGRMRDKAGRVGVLRGTFLISLTRRSTAHSASLIGLQLYGRADRERGSGGPLRMRDRSRGAVTSDRPPVAPVISAAAPRDGRRQGNLVGPRGGPSA